jgi:hypothetical protein
MADEVYSRVGSRVWLERWDDDTMLTALYLLTCKHRISEGIYHLPLQYIAADRRWPMKRVEKAIETLLKDEFIAYDRDAEVVLILSALKWQSPSTDNHKKGAVRKLRTLPPNGLMRRFHEQAQRLAPSFAEYIGNEMPEVFAHAI